MIAALFYLQFHSIKNRTLRRIKRLKQPKYLAFAVVGGLYFYFYFYRWLFVGGGRAASFVSGLSPEDHLLYELIGAALLLGILLMAWIIPHERASLAFTEAEVAFLFPAPISRRGLIHFKLLRSQTAILFTTFFLTLATIWAGGNAWIRGAGWWLVLNTLNLHLLGSSFARTLLLDRGITNWQRRLAILVLVVAAGLGLVWWARHTLPAFDIPQWSDAEAVKDYLRRLLTSGPAQVLLFPLRWLVRPYLAPDALAFLSSLPGPLVLLGLHYWWVLRMDVAFEEASLETSKKLADKLAALRAGRWQSSQTKPRGRRAPFRLRPVGPPSIALLWKNLISAGQSFSIRFWITIAAIGMGVSVGLIGGFGNSGFAPALEMVVLMLFLWSLLLGPHFLRQDFRQDLPLTDMLKGYPMRGWQVALGELLAPTVILSGIQWFLLLVAAGVFTNIHHAGSLGWSALATTTVGAALVLPFVNLINLQIPNAAVLLLPAWFQAAKDSPQGIEVTGQRLIFVLGQGLVFILSLIPAGAAGAGVFLLAQMFLGVTAGIALAAVAAAAVLAAEGALGLMLLGYLFERFDLSSEPSH
jgi:hypothetical protein